MKQYSSMWIGKTRPPVFVNDTMHESTATLPANEWTPIKQPPAPCQRSELARIKRISLKQHEIFGGVHWICKMTRIDDLHGQACFDCPGHQIEQDVQTSAILTLLSHHTFNPKHYRWKSAQLVTGNLQQKFGTNSFGIAILRDIFDRL